MLIRIICFGMILTGLWLVHGCSPNVENSSPPVSSIPTTVAGNIIEFEKILDDIRRVRNIPGLSAAIQMGGRVAWAKGFGMADRERGIAASTDTSFHLASLTKPIAAVILLQLFESGILDLDAPITQFGISVENGDNIRVRHLLTHTSEGDPGEFFQYNGDRYSWLGQVIQFASGRPFCDLLEERLINKFGLIDTAPNPELPTGQNCVLDDSNLRELFISNMAQGYHPDGETALNEMLHFSPAAGLLSSALDMTQFLIRLDRDQLLRPETRQLMFTQVRTRSGQPLPYGLGWFIDTGFEFKVQWHYGLWNAHSSLILRIPDRQLAFVVLANTNRLNPNIRADGNIRHSEVAMAFINAFVLGDAVLPESYLD